MWAGVCDNVSQEVHTVASTCNLQTTPSCGFWSNLFSFVFWSQPALHAQLNYSCSLQLKKNTVYHQSFLKNVIFKCFAFLSLIAPFLISSDFLLRYLLFLCGYGTHQRQWGVLVVTNSVSFVQEKLRKRLMISQSPWVYHFHTRWEVHWQIHLRCQEMQTLCPTSMAGV